MEFINKGNDLKVRLEDGRTWVTAYKGEIVNIPEEVGIANGLEKVEVVEEKVETVKPKKVKKSKRSK